MTDRQTNRQIDRQTDRQIDRQTNRQTIDRQADTLIYLLIPFIYFAEKKHTQGPNFHK